MDDSVVVVRERSAVVEAALDCTAAGPPQVVPRHELGALLDLGSSELSGRFRGMCVLPDLTRRAVDLGAPPPAGYLKDGWLWVDAAVLEALESGGRRRDAGRALVRHAAVLATHPDWTAATLAEEAPLPESAELWDVLGPTRTPTHSFGLFRDTFGRWGLRTPAHGHLPEPDEIANVVQVLVDDGDRYVRGTGTVVDVDDEAIWIVTARHLLREGAPVGALIAGAGYPATVVAPERRALARALARERHVLDGGGKFAAAARGLDLALLQIRTRTYSGPELRPVPLAPQLTEQTSVVTVGYSSHPEIEAVVVDLFGLPGADVVVVSAGTMDPGRGDIAGPLLKLATPVTAREAGGGRSAVVCDDPWISAGMSGGAMLVRTSGSGNGPAHALAAVGLGFGDAGEMGRVAIVADSAGVRALLRATRSASARGLALDP